jgi:hypothetical protein
MTYNNKKTFLISLIAVLALLYAGSLVFSSLRSGSRASSFVWIDPKLALKIHRIAIETADGTVELAKKNNKWFILHNGIEYPARQTRVEDFIGIFTQRAAWPVRSESASSHARFGLDAGAERVAVSGENSVILDMLLGDDDITGREIYVRKNGHDEVRSGSNAIRAYVTGNITGWYNLRLIPESEDGQIDADSVQRLTVSNGGETLVLSRKNRAWTVSGLEDAKVDQGVVENYIRTVLNIEGDNFSIFDEDYDFGNGNRNYVSLEFGNGVIKRIIFSEPDEDGRRIATVTESGEYYYSIPPWAITRLFRDVSSFERR